MESLVELFCAIDDFAKYFYPYRQAFPAFMGDGFDWYPSEDTTDLWAIFPPST